MIACHATGQPQRGGGLERQDRDWIIWTLRFKAMVTKAEDEAAKRAQAQIAAATGRNRY